MSFYNKASLLTIPTAYKQGKLYSVKPDDGSGDFTFTRSTSATRVNEAGLIESVGVDVPRIDYSSGTPSLLLEPQRTNLVAQSEDFSSTYWSKQCDIIPNTLTQPDGTQFGFSIKEITSNAYQYIYKSSFNVTVGNQYTFSVFAKSRNDVLSSNLSKTQSGLSPSWSAINITSSKFFSKLFI